MSPNEYNAKAKEAYGKFLIDIGLAIFKAILLLVTVVPLGAVIKVIFDDKKDVFSLVNSLNTLSLSAKLIIAFLFIASFLAGHFISQAGFRHLHEVEN